MISINLFHFSAIGRPLTSFYYHKLTNLNNNKLFSIKISHRIDGFQITKTERYIVDSQQISVFREYKFLNTIHFRSGNDII